MRTSIKRRMLAITIPALAVTGVLVTAFAGGVASTVPLSIPTDTRTVAHNESTAPVTTATAPIVHKTVTVPSKPKGSVATTKVVKVASSVPAEKDETPVVSGPMQDDETGTHPVATTPSNSDGPALGPATTTPIESGTPGGALIGSAH